MESSKIRSLPKPKIYGVDLDGVCFDFLGGFAKWLATNYNLQIRSENLSNYYWSGISEEDKEKIWKVYFHEFCKGGGLLSLDVLPGAINGLKLLISMGNTVHFITSREPYTLGDTVNAIVHKLKIYNPSVHIADHGGKSSYVKKLAVDTFIDDAPHTIAEVASNTRAQVYCMDQPYNKEVDTTFVRRVHNWQEFLEAEGWMKNV
jgi:uncharacterized HAD superfamily protein